MSDYLKAYRSRRDKIDTQVRDLAQQLKDRGCSVYLPKDDNGITFLKAYQGDKSVTIGFCEVPYRWTADMELDPSLKGGSGRNVDTRYDYDTPYTVDEALALMRPSPWTTPEVQDKKNWYLVKI